MINNIRIVQIYMPPEHHKAHIHGLYDRAHGCESRYCSSLLSCRVLYHPTSMFSRSGGGRRQEAGLSQIGGYIKC